MAVVSEKSWFGPCYSNCRVFKNAKKCCSFLVFTALIVRWDLAFAGSFCRLLASGSARAFCCFFNNKFQEFFKNSYYSRPHLLAQNHVILPNFWCFWRMTFREIEQFVLDGRLVLCVVDNFRLHLFLFKKGNIVGPEDPTFGGVENEVFWGVRAWDFVRMIFMAKGKLHFLVTLCFDPQKNKKLNYLNQIISSLLSSPNNFLQNSTYYLFLVFRHPQKGDAKRADAKKGAACWRETSQPQPSQIRRRTKWVTVLLE